MQKTCFNFNTKIWKIEPCGNHLLVELRDSETLSVEWKLVDIENEHILHTITHKESWWHSVAGTTKEHIVFHKFEQSKTPKISSVLIYNVQDYSFQLFNNTALKEITQNRIILQNQNGEEITISSNTTYQPTITEPLVYHEDNQYFKDFEELINSIDNQKIIKQCEYVENQDFIIFSYFLPNSRNLSSNLIVINKEGLVILREKLNDTLTGIVSNTFIIFNDKIVYIKNDKELTIIGLSNDAS